VISELTYLEFHLAFVLPALAAVALSARRRGVVEWAATLRLGVPVVTVLAVAYTTPWDNYLIARGVWWYADGAVVGTVARAPAEEYAFFVLQPALTALWIAHLAPESLDGVRVSPGDRVVGLLAAVVVGVVGVVAVLAAEATLYLGAILAWAAPVLALQWAFGWPALVRSGRTEPAPASRVAIGMGVWTLSPRYTTGLTVGGLPVEEGLFFLVTNLFVVQALVLLRWVLVAPSVAVPAPFREGTATVRRLREVVPW
jgi:lycopene cyclase domain-containing protein